MTKALQKRFVITAMIAVTLLLVVLIGAVNIVTLVFTNQRTDTVLSTLSAVRGTYDPEHHRPPQDREPHFPFRAPPTPDDMMGARYFSVFFDSQGKIVRTNITHIFAVTQAQAEQIAMDHYGQTEGDYEQFRFRSTPLSDGSGTLMLFLDISAQQNFQFTVLLVSCGMGLLCWLVMLVLLILLSRRAIAPFARNIEKQKQFVTNAGHEIKTPLSIILANTDALELHSGQTKWSRNIRAQTVRLNGLMQNLLTLSKMDESNVVLPTTKFSVSSMLLEHIQLLQASADAADIRLEQDIPSALIVTAHRDSIQQLFSILLDNAVKYTPPQGLVHIQLEQQDGKTRLQVSNTCPQTPEADLERLFDRFYRGDSARTQSSGGYGIGLSAARAIAQAHGGSVTASYDITNKIICFTAVF